MTTIAPPSHETPRPRAGRVGSFVLWYGLSSLAVAAVGTYIALAIFWQANPPVVPVAGASMRPALQAGDIIVVKGVRPEELRKGDIIAFHPPASARERYGLPSTFVHRIDEITEEADGLRIQTKGDANSGPDAFTIRAPDVVGRSVATLPALGYPFLFFRSRQGLIFAAALGAVLLVYFLLGAVDRREEQGESEKVVLQALYRETQGLKEQLEAGVATTTTTMRGPPRWLVDHVRRSGQQSQETADTMRELVGAIGEYGTHLKSHTAVMKNLAATTAELHRAATGGRAAAPIEPVEFPPEPEEEAPLPRRQLTLVREDPPPAPPAVDRWPGEDVWATIRRPRGSTVVRLHETRREGSMSMTPDELRHVRLERSLRGYDRDAVDRLLGEIRESYDELWRERDELRREREDLRGHVEQLEQEIDRVRELENTLTHTLVSAERAASDLKAQAQRETELILAEAQAQARTLLQDASVERERLLAEARSQSRQLLDDAAAERDRLAAEVRNFRSLLQAAFTALDERRLPEEPRPRYPEQGS